MRAKLLGVARALVGMTPRAAVRPLRLIGPQRNQAPEQQLMAASFTMRSIALRSTASPRSIAIDASSTRRCSASSSTRRTGRTPSSAYVGSSISTRTPSVSACKRLRNQCRCGARPLAGPEPGNG